MRTGNHVPEHKSRSEPRTTAFFLSEFLNAHKPDRSKYSKIDHSRLKDALLSLKSRNPSEKNNIATF